MSRHDDNLWELLSAVEVIFFAAGTYCGIPECGSVPPSACRSVDSSGNDSRMDSLSCTRALDLSCISFASLMNRDWVSQFFFCTTCMELYTGTLKQHLK